jgi:hypothetical protein
MKSEFSEFSYGFAVTHGLLKDKPSIDVAPHFPSLVEEGKVWVFSESTLLPGIMPRRRSPRVLLTLGSIWLGMFGTSGTERSMVGV